jgi:hypothetical protein
VQEERRGFLPPEPPGPEPELGGRGGGDEQPPPAHPPPAPPPPGSGWPGPAGQQQGSPPEYGWQQQPPAWQQPPPWGYPPAAREPDNGPAIAGFVLSLVSGGLLIFSLGLSSIVSLACAVAGLIYSRKGKQRVDAGETSKNRSLAQAGYVISIVGLVLSVLATAFWVLILVLAIVDEDFQRDLENSNSVRASVRLTAAALRAGSCLLG